MGRRFGGGAPSRPRARASCEVPSSTADSSSLSAGLRDGARGLERRAAVAAWGLRSSHLALLLPPAEPEDLEAVARREARTAPGGIPAGPVADAVVIGGLREDGRREVGYVAVAAEELRTRLQPLVDAGFKIESALTPAMAHAAIVRQRRSLLPDAVVAVLSVNARSTALTVLRGGVVLFARELPWGAETHDDDRAAGTTAAHAMAVRLAAELRRSFVYVRHSHAVEIGRVLLCGDAPDMRSLTAPLMSELSLDVEILDVADDVDLSELLEPSDPFRSRITAWQTALAIAADDPPPAGLEPREAEPGAARSSWLRRLATAAAIGLVIVAAGWGLVGHLAGRAATDAQRLRRAVAALEPELQRQDEARRQGMLAVARGAAMTAFASQGPRLARVLETLGRAAPPEVALGSLVVEPATGSWHVTIEGQAEGSDAASAQAALNGFLKALDSSPLLGRALAPPALKVRTADPVPAGAVEAAAPPPVQTQRAAQEVKTRQPGTAGPSYIEVARDGRLYRIPLRRQSGSAEATRLQALASARAAAALQQAEVGPPAASGAEEPPARHPASVIDFTLRYEVPK